MELFDLIMSIGGYLTAAVILLFGWLGKRKLVAALEVLEELLVAVKEAHEPSSDGGKKITAKEQRSIIMRVGRKALLVINNNGGVKSTALQKVSAWFGL